MLIKAECLTSEEIIEKAKEGRDLVVGFCIVDVSKRGLVESVDTH